MSVLEVTIEHKVATLKMNRPEARNAFNAELSTALGEALEAANTNPDVRVIVITGEGKAFSAGADLRAIGAGEDISPSTPEWGFGGVAQHWVDKPTIAAINGFAMGGGMEVALACDLIVAVESATFALPEVKRGLAAAGGGLLRIQHQVTLRRALQIALVGEPITARTALEWGLINDVVEDGELGDAVAKLAGAIAANAPTAVRESKKLLHRTAHAKSAWDADWHDDPWPLNVELIGTVFTHPDAKEGPAAFMEKREPNWQD